MFVMGAFETLYKPILFPRQKLILYSIYYTIQLMEKQVNLQHKFARCWMILYLTVLKKQQVDLDNHARYITE